MRDCPVRVGQAAWTRLPKSMSYSEEPSLGAAPNLSPVGLGPPPFPGCQGHTFPSLPLPGVGEAQENLVVYTPLRPP